MRATVVAVVVALAAGACGGEEETAPPPEPPPPPETLDRVPDLPERWEVHSNRAGGFAFGLPPGWRARNEGPGTRVESFDRLVAVSIQPDRTDEALELPLDTFAIRAFGALPGLEGGFAPRGPHRFRHEYDAVQMLTEATAEETGVRQTVRVVVIRRDPYVTLTSVIAANVEGGEESERLAERIVRTLRSRPIAGAPPG